MIKLKKIFSTLAALTIAFSLLFTGCSEETKNTAPTIKATEPQYRDKNGIGYNENSDGSLTISTFSNGKSDLKIPAEYNGKDVKEIGKSSFKMAKVKSVKIPEGVTKIDNYAFAFSRSLEKITIPDSVKEIGTNAFSGCVKLKKIKLPKKLEYIGMFSFDATAIKKIDIPKTVKKIDEYAFAECLSLKEVTINSKNTEIAKTAFNRSIHVVITAPKKSKAIKTAKSENIDYKTK